MALAGQFVLAADFGQTESDIQTGDIAGFTNTAYAPGSTLCGIAFVANTFGKAELVWTAYAESNAANRVVHISVHVRTGAVVGSGDTVLAPADDRSIAHGDSSSGASTRINTAQSYPLTGLTPHATYNVTTEHRITGDNGDILYRSVMVRPEH